MPASRTADATRSTAGETVTCPVCRGRDAEPFFEIAGAPVHCNVLWPTAETAAAALRGAIQLAFCRQCGLIWNAAFDPALVTYDAAYENSLHCSPRFQAYAAELARDLAGRYALRGKLVAEAGCGKGEFLRALCRTAGARGLGIDASYDPGLSDEEAGDITFVRQPFSALQDDVQPSLIVCRHVIEHLADPISFVSEFAAAARRSPGCHVFLEVPNVLYTLRDLGIWDVIYEHGNYFSETSLRRLCEEAGLTVERVAPAYGDQFLCLEASASAGAGPTRRGPTTGLSELEHLVARFASEYRAKVGYWASRLAGLAGDGRTVALWGAGSKGVTFVNTVPGGHRIACLVDLNPRKQGRFVPGTGQPVASPGVLASIRPDVVLVMNPLYRQEIGDQLARMGIECGVEVA